MSTRPAWHLAVVLAAAVLVMHAPVLVGGQTWADPIYLGEVLPSRLAAADAVAHGELPAWWSGTGLGVPLAAAPHHGALYPPHWLPALSGSRTVDGGSSLGGGLLDLVLLLHVWWAAVGVAIWSRRLGAGDLGAVVAGAAFAISGVIAASILGGAVVAIAHLPWVGWAADRVGMAAGGHARARAAVALALALGGVVLTGQLAVAIDAALLALAMTAARARGVASALVATVAAIVVGVLLGAVQLWPAIVHLAGDVAGAAPAETPVWLGVVVPGAGAPFVGIPVIALAAIAAIGYERRVGTATLGLAALGVLLAAAWPRTGLAGDPAVHVAAAAAAAAALAGAGFSSLADERPDGTTLAVLGGAIVAVTIAALAQPSTGAVVAVLVGAGALLALVAAGSRGFAAGAPLAAALWVGHPAALAHGAPRVERARVSSVPLLLQPAIGSAGTRVYRPRRLDGNDPDAGRRAIDDHDTAAGDVASLVGLAKVPTFDPGRSALEDPVWRAAGAAGGRLLDRYGIEWAVLPASVVPAADLEVAATRGRWALVATRPARPRAFVAPRWRSVADRQAVVPALFPAAGAGASLDTAVLVGQGEGGPPAGAPTPAPPCGVTRRGHQVHLDCEAPAGGWALLLDAWAPGWTVTVDGATARGVVADALVRGVRVAPGRHSILWTYRTPGLAAGALVSAGAALAVIAAWLAARRRRS